MVIVEKTDVMPSLDEWLLEAKKDKEKDEAGMYLMHNGVVRKTPKSLAREGKKEKKTVKGMTLLTDWAKVEDAAKNAEKMKGINYVRLWIGNGDLKIGDSIMLVLLGGDTRTNVLSAFDALMNTLKGDCLEEKEIYEQTI